MELRVLQYFLAVTREQSISGAAQYLHLSQPTLSRQLMDLEEELGKQLLIRGNRRITLTEEGMLLRKRAEEILDLVKKTENEISLSDEMIAGDVTIGAGETDGVRLLAKAAEKLRAEYPLIHFHMISGDSVSVLEQLDKGLIDFGLLLGDLNLSKYETLKLPARDVWGVLLRRDSPLSAKESIRPEDLRGVPLILSRQATGDPSPVYAWLRKGGEPNIIATYNLVFNASLMVEEGMGCALTLDKLIHVDGPGTLCFRPLSPAVTIDMRLVWKKYQILTKASGKFLEKLQEAFALSG